MRVSIHQPNFVPWYPFFQKIKEVDIFVYLKNVNLKRMDTKIDLILMISGTQ